MKKEENNDQTKYIQKRIFEKLVVTQMVKKLPVTFGN
jgi:hypothetical protein